MCEEGNEVSQDKNAMGLAYLHVIRMPKQVTGVDSFWLANANFSRPRNDLLEIIEYRHGNGITLADAILDSLLHNSHKIKLEGESLREIQAEKNEV